MVKQIYFHFFKIRQITVTVSDLSNFRPVSAQPIESFQIKTDHELAYYNFSFYDY